LLAVVNEVVNVVVETVDEATSGKAAVGGVNVAV
jgi:hypothetical protein